MSKKGKAIVILALSVFVVLSLVLTSGCGKKPEPPVEEPTPTVVEQPAPEPQVTEPQRRDDDAIKPPRDLAFNTVYFDFDKSAIRSDQRNTINRTAQLLDKYPSVKVLIEGHCDERGSNEYNLALGQRRADATKQYLVDYGISSSRVSTVSHGEERPVAAGHNESAWSKNRRAEFVITAR